MAFCRGWYEDEYSPETGQRWRWTGASAQLRLVSSRTVVLHIRGESPLKYVGSAPTVRIGAGSRTLATYHPAADFTWRITVPVEALTEAQGVITIETIARICPVLPKAQRTRGSSAFASSNVVRIWSECPLQPIDR
jgi:hypothetical protein